LYSPGEAWGDLVALLFAGKLAGPQAVGIPGMLSHTGTVPAPRNPEFTGFTIHRFLIDEYLKKKWQLVRSQLPLEGVLIAKEVNCLRICYPIIVKRI
jgi:hypothetical protein